MTTRVMAPRTPSDAQMARWGSPTQGAPPWFTAAWGELDEREITGVRSNARIVGYHATTSLRATDDSVPWCSSFVNWALTVRGYRGTNDARAISWTERPDLFRTLLYPRLGCVVVVRHRGARDTSTGSASGNHVALYLRGTSAGVPPTLTLLGGNQGDSVSLATFALGGGPTPGFDVLGAYWPRAYALPAATPEQMAVAAAWAAAKRASLRA